MSLTTPFIKVYHNGNWEDIKKVYHNSSWKPIRGVYHNGNWIELETSIKTTLSPNFTGVAGNGVDSGLISDITIAYNGNGPYWISDEFKTMIGTFESEDGNKYWNDRGFMSFDTSSIPSDATILRIEMWANNQNGIGTLHLKKYNFGGSMTSYQTDYDGIKNETDEYGEINFLTYFTLDSTIYYGVLSENQILLDDIKANNQINIGLMSDDDYTNYDSGMSAYYDSTVSDWNLYIEYETND